MKLDNVKFTNGATKTTAETILKGISKDLAERENNILDNLAEVEQNNYVPAGYTIYEFCDKNGDSFEAGKTPAGYSVTN